MISLKNITLGQFFPGESFFHKRDPRVKILYLLLFITTLFLCDSIIEYGVMVLLLLIMIGVTKIHPGNYVHGMKPVFVLLCFTALLNLISTPGNEIFRAGFLKVTEEGIWRACYISFRLIMLIASTLVVTFTTSPLVLMDGLEWLLNPLKIIHVPVHELSMMMSIAVRFIPTLVQETDKIISAQKARGGNIDQGNIFHRLKAFMPIFIPLFISSFRRVEELSTAMECRCYHGGEGRTKMYPLKMRRADWMFLFISAILLIMIPYIDQLPVPV